MVELMILMYAGVLWLVFKQFKLIPVTTYTMLGAVLFGVGLIGWVLTMMNMYQPYTPTARFYYTTTPIVPEVRGPVISIDVEPNQQVPAGTVLFRIDPAAFQAVVDRLEAEVHLAQLQLDRATELRARGAGPQVDVDRAQAQVDSLEAQLAQAQLDLDHTQYRAPADGYVTQLLLRPGVMAVPLPLAPVGVFVHAEAPVLVAAFPQNPLQGLDVGDEAEVLLHAIPGRVFQARVTQIQPALGEGQLRPTGQLITLPARAADGRVPVLIEITDDLSQYNLPAGISGEVAVYSGEYHPFEIIRRILLRMKAWERYLFLP